MKAELNNLIEPDEKYKRMIYDSEKELLKLLKPNVWNTNISGNMEVETEVEFEKFLSSLSEHTNENLDQTTVFRFYSLVELIKEKHSKNGRSDNQIQ